MKVYKWLLHLCWLKLHFMVNKKKKSTVSRSKTKAKYLVMDVTTIEIIISWSTKKKKSTVSRSNTKAKYLVMAMTIA